ncbi:hypothetical protein B0A49_01347 [Cryomyces minteri]|uniref:Non-homologous end-joining factor 1 n=1 Tax=Cryomyces minteri TaxID=331657 RepID=A0A4U0XX29_9PEZI|nr:hypothetical protein B0A49_01347 [Cryomyces minteri]
MVSQSEWTVSTTMTGTWSPLSLPNTDQQLLIKASPRTKGYTVHLTDLCYLWSETVSEQTVMRRAVEQGSSIDPSEDESQFSILLDKILGALRCEIGTKRELRQRGDESGLLLELTVPLPSPLMNLQWPVYLSKVSQKKFSTDFVLPLLSEAYIEKQHVSELVECLGEKDHVIAKLLDKFESSGADLTTIFPGFAGIKTMRKDRQRDQMTRQVKGLGAFDEQTWRERSSHVSLEGLSMNKIVNRMFNSTTALELETFFAGPMHDSQPTEWWECLGDPAIAKDSSLGHFSTERASATAPHDNEGFQRQATPPNLQKSGHVEPFDQRPKAINSSDADDDDDDDDDLDVPSQQTIQVRSLGRGKVRLSTESEALSNRPLSTADPAVKKTNTVNGFDECRFRTTTMVDEPLEPRLVESGSDTTDDEDEKKTSTHPGISRDGGLKHHVAQTHKSKLGVIGGSQRSADTATDTISKVNSATPNPPAKDHAGRVVLIGKTRSNTPSYGQITATTEEPSTETDLNECSADAVASSGSPPRRETSQESADKKRNALKRQLEEKAKTPVKKKRRF